jgi:hypothetical protein
MKKTPVTLLALAAALWSLSGQGALRVIEAALELDPASVRLPRHEAGQLVVRECSSCDVLILRVDAGTTYHIGVSSPAISLQQLLDEAAARRKKLAGIYVFYRPEAKTVTRVILSTRS